MFINFLENIIELTSTNVVIKVDKKSVIQIIFEGDNELDYFLVRRFFEFGNDNNRGISNFYTQGCDTNGYWTYISATFAPNLFSFLLTNFQSEFFYPKYRLKKYKKLRDTLSLALEDLGHFTDNTSL